MSIKETIKVANYYNAKYNNFNKFAIPAIPPSMSKPPPGPPPGYKKIKNNSPKVRAKALEVLKKIKTEGLTFGYLEPFSDVVNSKVIEYIVKIEAHYDNHPKAKTNPEAAPYWHIGVSIYEKES